MTSIRSSVTRVAAVHLRILLQMRGQIVRSVVQVHKRTVDYRFESAVFPLDKVHPPDTGIASAS